MNPPPQRPDPDPAGPAATVVAGPDTAPATTGPRRRPTVLVLVLLLVAAGAFAAGRLTADAGEPVPADTSAEAGFARDMQTHHRQAVTMSMIVRDRTTDPEVRVLAYDVALGQQHQIGQMFAWLVQWGLPQTGTGPALAWMTTAAGGDTPAGHTTGGMSGHGQGTSSAGPGMPGMATAADLQRLTQLHGRDAEILYLQLMIAHHRAGVAMAQALLDRCSDHPDVRGIAQTIITSQTSEIGTMQAMRYARDANR
ncbi:DUF305 domain-containing protein [Candidatus Protofrankia californiensis]|uniref:DUF305 domain-containing protein n=1 Tax=Candidatus Protofrankia californiensis TaxID=1839754 RepID=UPI00104144E7|nr:DUF305 domain-containing protein [Candidatus Protofrankia californiensis]